MGIMDISKKTEDSIMRETRVENGALRGVACGWPSITAYYGIPYAAPPGGELRWREPQPAVRSSAM